jgi:hypothetical protein
MAVQVRFIARLIAVFEHANLIVFELRLILVAIGMGPGPFNS